MSLTRTALKERGVDKETIDFIMEAHGETVESAKEKAKTTAESAAEKKLFEMQSKVDAAHDDWKTKYEAEKAAHTATMEGYKNEKLIESKRTALRTALKAEGANEKLIELLESKFEFENIALDGDKIKGWSDMVKPVKEQFSEVFGTVQTVGAGIATPPKNESIKSTVYKDMNSFIRGITEKGE